MVKVFGWLSPMEAITDILMYMYLYCCKYGSARVMIEIYDQMSQMLHEIVAPHGACCTSMYIGCVMDGTSCGLLLLVPTEIQEPALIRLHSILCFDN